MSHTPVQSGPAVLMEEDERWAVVLRVASSRQFARASQLRDILLYVCQRAISEPGAVIKEHEIGCNALGRKSDFNPQEDNIVRVQVSQVRKRLDEYFASEGKDERVHITIPKGAYVPRFDPRPERPVTGTVVVETALRRKRRGPGIVPALMAVILLLALGCIYFAVRQPAGGSAGEIRSVAADPFWSRLFVRGQPTEIVVSDSCLVTMQDVLNTDLSVGDYVGGKYPNALLEGVKSPELKSALQLLTSRQYTSLADLNLSSKMLDFSRPSGASQVSLHFARHLNIRDLKRGNFIVLGSRRGVPWVKLFEPQLNFTMERDARRRQFFLRNKQPKPGELATYAPSEHDGALETYADIALVPNLGNNGSVLLLAGLSMVDTEAAGELVIRKDYWKELAKLIGIDTVRSGYFELLLKTRAVAGAPEDSRIVTSRVIQPGTSSR